MNKDQYTLINGDNILQYISYLGVSLYCYSTEARFLEDSKKSKLKHQDISDSENWLSRSLEIVYTFLPNDMPLVDQIISVYNKFHGIHKQIIPEDR